MVRSRSGSPTAAGHGGSQGQRGAGARALGLLGQAPAGRQGAQEPGMRGRLACCAGWLRAGRTIPRDAQIIGNKKRKLSYVELGAVPTVLALLDSPDAALQQQSMDCVGR